MDKKNLIDSQFKMDISIIIVSWNTRSMLAQCLDSLDAQNQSINMEIIVVDNASADGTVEMIEKQYPKVKLIKNDDNLGFAKANNIGIRASAGRYVCLVNSDVIVLEDCMERLVAFMDDNPSVGLAGPRVLNPDKTLQVSCRRFPGVWNNLCQVFGLNKLFPNSAFFSDWFMNDWAHDRQSKVDVLSGCFWIVRRDALEDVGLLDEEFFIYGEDVDWCRRFHKARWEVVFFPDARIIHFGGASSANAPVRFYLEMQKADLKYWKKHHGNVGAGTYRVIILARQIVRMPYYLVKCIVSSSQREVSLSKLKRSLACIRLLLTWRIT